MADFVLWKKRTRGSKMAEVIGILGMFASILVILRWFKTDTADMMKIYSESTKAQIDAIKEDVKAIKEDVKAIKDDVKDFHARLFEIERNRGK